MKVSTVWKPLRSEVGTLWSQVAKVQSGRRTGRPALRRPSKAWGEVTCAPHGAGVRGRRTAEMCYAASLVPNLLHHT